MAKKKTWTVEADGDPIAIRCESPRGPNMFVFNMVRNGGLLIDPTESYASTITLAQQLVDVLNREMPYGVARKHGKAV